MRKNYYTDSTRSKQEVEIIEKQLSAMTHFNTEETTGYFLASVSTR